MNYEGQCCSIHEAFGNFGTGCLIFMLLVGKQDCEVLIEGFKENKRKEKKLLALKWKEINWIKELDMFQSQINTAVGE